MAKELTWKDAIEKVLKEAGTAIHYKEIADRIIEEGLRKNIGATPAKTVSAHLTVPLKKYGEKCPWQKVDKGTYIWKKNVGIVKASKKDRKENEGETEEQQYDVISSFGMFWSRDAVEWTSRPKILGMQQIGADSVDFYGQNGIYLLYDGREVIYVGRATERPLGRRLYEHTLDRLSSRWDRFSWFGVLPVSSAGEFGRLKNKFQSSKLLPALEAILIEALEPRQNRKRGDDLSAVEYIQKDDPEIKKKAAKQFLDEALHKA